MEQNSPLAFVYPESVEHRKHGPAGYLEVQSFRPWLRDEFLFRCAYCLDREQWGKVTGEFDIDHFVQVSSRPDLGLQYDNLVYSCRTCNARKGSKDIPDPFQQLTRKNVVVGSNGRLVGLTKDSHKIIDKLALNSDKHVQWRLTWMRVVELASQYDLELLNRLMGYPEDLPNLESLQPPDNQRPDGIASSYFAKRERSELATSYIC